ncbi:sensor domain-containing diguanylate cyclase [Aliidiomarina halalkaliphila]|uniref:diguanylate cyclase n=1 Tax=Aliidiomarina halalkaliphila TaxID=2593535 RepID=A0A552X4M1_9GAMM|nr:sensor domain-containing diguanylate cyclase [Aliidiomarina halalkaliphila]TRW49553.1 sensor domain-containing diguanylate cyclase [Aliidiomarina halalkaliphila]
MQRLLDTLARVVEQESADSSDLENFVRPLLDLLADITGLESTYLTSINDQESIQEIVYAVNANEEPLIPEGLQVPWGDTLCKRSLEEARTVTQDVAATWGDSDAARELGLMTYMSEPVRGVDGSIVGTLCGVSRKAQPISQEALRLLGVCAKIIGWQLQRSELISQLHEQNKAFAASALLDPLTGVLNRRGLEKELKRANAVFKRTHQPYHIAFIDLDNFKQINDTFGHDAGDRFLLQVCERLNTTLREGDVLARVGGDEFVVIGWPSNITTDELAAFKQRLQETISGDYAIDDFVIEYGGASIGTVFAAAEEEYMAVLERADRQMYDEKKRRQGKAN